MPNYKIADITFKTNHIYTYTAMLCKDYLCDCDKVDLVINISNADIDYERSLAGAGEFSNSYLESLALYRKLCDYMLQNANGMIFHSSAIMVDNKAYLFTAPSGTGKSTHARLWREMLGDKAVMINDDKPLIRLIDGKFFVYGTPWNGKHKLGCNIKVPIKAICEITRGNTNEIKRLSPREFLIGVMNQTLRPNNERDMDKLLVLVDKLLKSVDLYLLKCDVSLEASRLSYETMRREEEYEN